MNKTILTSGIITLGIPLLYSLTKSDLYYIICYISILLSTINYWRKPKKGLRRNIDITCVCHGFIYQNYLIYNGLISLPYYTFMGIGLSYYFLSNWCTSIFPSISNYLHCCFHIFTNLASLSLIIQF
jgi:hypothetical protein